MTDAYFEHRKKAEDLWRELWSIYFYQTDHDDNAVIDELFAALCPPAQSDHLLVRRDDIQFCIDAIAKLHDGRAKLRLEKMLEAS